MDKKIVVSLDDVDILAKESGDILFTPGASKALAGLLRLHRYIEEKITEVKKIIQERGNEVSPGFKGIMGEGVRCLQRSFGPRFTYDPQKTDPFFLQRKEMVALDPKKVAVYEKKNRKLPEGVSLAERKETLLLTLIEEKLLE